MDLKKSPKPVRQSHPPRFRQGSANKSWSVTGTYLILMLAFLIGTSYVIYRMAFARMEKLGQDVVNLRSAMNIDSVRQYQIQKVMKIIDLHNKGLSATEAYEIANEIYELSLKYTNLNVDLICAVITHESAGTWNPTVVSKANAMGLMQVMPVTGFFLAEYEKITWTSPEDVLFNPMYNLRIGTRLLSALITRYNLDGGLAAYNGGEKQAAIWLANGKFPRFKNYTHDTRAKACSFSSADQPPFIRYCFNRIPADFRQNPAKRSVISGE
jgi:soluble lytic murein transglycosylase-like protein